MTKPEATAYLKWYEEKVSEYHYLASFKSSTPFHVAYPNAGVKKRRAKIALGIHEFQKEYADLKRVYTGLKLERYHKQRKKLGLTK